MSNKPTHLIVLGAQWGDEGKGKIVDIISAQAGAVCRFQGGHNAGHTLVVDGKKLILHLVPSGILHDSVACFVATGTVICLASLVTELNALSGLGVNYHERLHVSLDAHIILPYHVKLDQLREKRAKAKQAIGTTGRGIGPAYEDKIARRGIRLFDLLATDNIEEIIVPRLALYNQWFSALFDEPAMTMEDVLSSVTPALTKIAPLACDVKTSLYDAHATGKTILFEGAQGALLDIAHGTYPFVTSSHTTVGGALTGTGFGHLLRQPKVIGIAKAYVTRVGNGFFPTELHDETGAYIAKQGHEFGATTGRPRRCGWLDAVALRSVVRDNIIDALCLTKLDVLDGLDTLQVCITYKLGNKRYEYVPEGLQWQQVKPEYRTFVGWSEAVAGVTNWEQLPSAAQEYITTLEEIIGVPIVFISTGAERHHIITRHSASISLC